MQELILIKSLSKRNVLTSALVGSLGLVFGVLIMIILPITYYLAGIFFISLAVVAFIVAWVKYREPEFSFIISKDEIVHKRRQGKWVLAWSNIQRVDIPQINRGMNIEPLDMVGIKLKEYSVFLDVISPRLMTNILMEQRSLLLLSSEHCSTGSCYSEDILEADYFKSSCGQEYKGIKAMFANRMDKLRQRLGYDLYISAADLDRNEQDFVQLLRSCQQYVLTHDES